MDLREGTLVGRYEILARLGVGGMGEVYQARDTRLGRMVALKFLNERIAAEPGRRERFQTEARAISSLNHPNICGLFDVAEQDGVTFLVMEYVEGETLDDRLTRGALPAADVLRFAVQIADALDHAHQQGVIHRDLKPSNVMLTRAGAKLLDFGLARLPSVEMRSPVSTVSLPPSRLTAEGTILGTFAYMAPEQLEGKEADARTDIFTFGTVLYEMATGCRAFEGKSQASLIAAILERDPPAPSSQQAMLPPAFDHLVRRCLAKNPNDRWRSARDVMFELRWIAERASEANAAHVPQRFRERVAWSAAGVALLIGVAGVVAALGPREAGQVQVAVGPLMRLDFELPPSAPMAIEDQTALALSVDGTRLAYVAKTATGTQLYLRLLDRLNALPIAGTEGGSMPFFSPDARWVAFFAQGKLKKVPIEGGTPIALADAPMSRGGTWALDDTIIYTPGVNGGLMRVSASGGPATALTTPDTQRSEVSHRWVEALPDGKSVVFTIWSGFGRWEEARTAILSLDSSKPRILPLEGAADAHYSKTGHLVYRRGGTFMAVPFDLQRTQITGQPVTVVENVATSVVNNAHAAVSNSGLIVYAQAPQVGSVYALRWVDRSGGETAVALSSPALEEPRISPNGEHIVLTLREKTNADVWTYHLGRGELKKITSEVTEEETPAWTPDNQYVTFSAARAGHPRSIFRKRPGVSEPEELLLRADANKDDHPHVDGWSPDGETLALTNMSGSAEQFDITLLRPRDASPVQPFLRTKFNEGAARFSPDGHWLAYVSDESGRFEVYVRAARGSGDAHKISTGGGTEPVWARNGTELFFRSGDRMMVAAVRLKPTFGFEQPRMLFEQRYAMARRGRLHANYDVASDGRRFLMLKEIGQTTATQLSLVLNALK